MTPATDAVREARAREIAWKLVIGDKVGGGDGQTYVCRTPTVREIEAALLAFADTEAASQPREGDTWEALKVIDRIANRLHNNGQPHSATDLRAAAKIVEAALIQRPPEQAGAVPAGIDVTAMVSEALGDHQCGNRPALKKRLIADIRAALSAAPTPPDAGPGEIPAGMVAMREALDEIIANDDEDATVSDLMQHDRNAGYLAGVRDCADIARRALTPKAPPQTPPDAGIGSDGAGEEWTFVPDEREKSAIIDLCADQDLSPKAVMRQAIRQYQSDHLRRKNGETVTWSGDEQRARDFAGPLATQPGDGGRS